MKPTNPIPDRLKPADAELGVPNEAEIEQRAIELAESDGRDAYTDADIAQATAELTNLARRPAAPEADPEVEQLTEWDTPTDQAGHRVEPLPADDETTIAEQLIDDGNAEADHDLRVAAEQDDEEES